MSIVRFNRSPEYREWADYKSGILKPDRETMVEAHVSDLYKKSIEYLNFLSPFRNDMNDEENNNYEVLFSYLDCEAAKAIACAKFVLRKVCNSDVNVFKELLETKFDRSFTKMLQDFEAKDLLLDLEESRAAIEKAHEELRKAKEEAEELRKANEKMEEEFRIAKEEAEELRKQVKMEEGLCKPVEDLEILRKVMKVKEEELRESRKKLEKITCELELYVQSALLDFLKENDTDAKLDKIYNLLFRQGENIGKMVAQYLDKDIRFLKLKEIVLIELQIEYENVYDAAKAYKNYLLATNEMIYKTSMDKHLEEAKVCYNQYVIAGQELEKAELAWRSELEKLAEKDARQEIDKNSLDEHCKKAKEKLLEVQKKYSSATQYFMACEAWHKSKAEEAEKEYNPLKNKYLAIKEKLSATENFLTSFGADKQLEGISVGEYREKFTAMYKYDKDNSWKEKLAAERNPITNALVQGLVRVGQILGDIVVTVIPALKNWHDRLFRPEGYGLVLQNHAVVDKLGLNRSVGG